MSHVPNKKGSKHKLIKLKGEIDKSTRICVDFSTPPSKIEHTRKPVRFENNRTTLLNKLIKLLQATSPNNSRMYMLFSAHRTFIKNIHYILCHKTKLNQCKRIQIIQSKFCDHEGINFKNQQLKDNFIYLEIKQHTSK